MERALVSLLYQVPPRDPSTFASVAAILLGVAILVCWLPARLATRIDPAYALKQDSLIKVKEYLPEYISVLDTQH